MKFTINSRDGGWIQVDIYVSDMRTYPTPATLDMAEFLGVNKAELDYDYSGYLKVTEAQFWLAVKHLLKSVQSLP